MDQPPFPADPPSRSVAGNAIRAEALSLLIGGGLCLYFGFTLIATAPGSANEQETARWFAMDNAFFWSLRIVGGVLLAAAGLAALGNRLAMLLATIGEAAFAALMFAMAIGWTLKARAMGGWDYFVILLVIFGIISLGGVKRSWNLYRITGSNKTIGE